VRLAAIASAKVEGDIIEAFVRHTLAFVDVLAIVDNASLDDTRAILERLVAEGLSLTIWEGEAVTGDRAHRTRNARRALAEFGCDYLLLLDVDEFVVAPSRAALEAELAGLPAGTHALVAERTYVMTPDDDPSESNPIARIRHRLVREQLPLEKVFVSKSFLGEPDALVVPGNHAVSDPNGASRSALLPTIALAHFPVRSLAQIRNKAVLGWPRFLAMGFDEKRGVAYHWRELNQDLERGDVWDDTTLFGIANDYHGVGGDAGLILDPLPVPRCRYPYVARGPLATAIAFTRQMATAFAAIHAERLGLARSAGNAVAAHYRDLLVATVGEGDARAVDRAASMRALCECVEMDCVPGDVFVAGARRAETAVVARGVFAGSANPRRVWIADSFDGRPPPNVGAFDDREAVCNGLRRFGFLDDASVFVEGWFDATLGTCEVERIAVLALDVGSHDAAYTALQSLYTRVSRRGCVAALNYTLSEGARSGVDAFRSRHRIESPLRQLGTNGVYWST
jgi:hypothetical protein